MTESCFLSTVYSRSVWPRLLLVVVVISAAKGVAFFHSITLSFHVVCELLFVKVSYIASAANSSLKLTGFSGTEVSEFCQALHVRMVIPNSPFLVACPGVCLIKVTLIRESSLLNLGGWQLKQNLNTVLLE